MFEYVQWKQLFTHSYYNYNNQKVYCLSQDKQVSSRILSISCILIQLHILKVQQQTYEIFSSQSTLDFEFQTSFSTSIHETPMADPDSESLQEYKDTNSLRSMEVLQHVLQKVPDIKDEEEIQSFSKWMKYRGYDNFTDICADFCHILDRIHNYSEFRADGQGSALKFSTMNKIIMFTSQMGIRVTDGFLNSMLRIFFL